MSSPGAVEVSVSEGQWWLRLEGQGQMLGFSKARDALAYLQGNSHCGRLEAVGGQRAYLMDIVRLETTMQRWGAPDPHQQAVSVHELRRVEGGWRLAVEADHQRQQYFIQGAAEAQFAKALVEKRNSTSVDLTTSRTQGELEVVRGREGREESRLAALLRQPGTGGREEGIHYSGVLQSPVKIRSSGGQLWADVRLEVSSRFGNYEETLRGLKFDSEVAGQLRALKVGQGVRLEASGPGPRGPLLDAPQGMRLERVASAAGQEVGRGLVEHGRINQSQELAR